MIRDFSYRSHVTVVDSWQMVGWPTSSSKATYGATLRGFSSVRGKRKASRRLVGHGETELAGGALHYGRPAEKCLLARISPRVHGEGTHFFVISPQNCMRACRVHNQTCLRKHIFNFDLDIHFSRLCPATRLSTLQRSLEALTPSANTILAASRLWQRKCGYSLSFFTPLF